MDEWIVYRRRRKADVGATYLAKDGYTWMKVSNDSPKWMLAHRWAMEQKLGRPLLRGEAVHHQCHDRACWDASHLELIDPSEHTRLHQTGRKQPPEQVKNRLEAQARYWAQPGKREAHAEFLRALWRDPAYRAKLRIGRKTGWVRRKASGRPHNAIGRKDSPEVIAKRSQHLSEYWLANRERASAIAKTRWADPAYRAAQQKARERRARQG